MHGKSRLLGGLRVFDSHSRVEHKLGYRGRYSRLDFQTEPELWENRVPLSVGVRKPLDSPYPEDASPFLGEAEVPRMIYAELRMVIK